MKTFCRDSVSVSYPPHVWTASIQSACSLLLSEKGNAKVQSCKEADDCDMRVLLRVLLSPTSSVQHRDSVCPGKSKCFPVH